MKKLIAVLLCVAMVFAFAACTGKAEKKCATTVKLNSELYGVGFRKGSDLTAELNKFLKASLEDGSITKCAEKYKVQEALVESFEEADAAKAEVKDLDAVKEAGKLVVGITDFEPMDYKDTDGNWIGFDADMATAFAKSLGVDVEFVEINWDNKVFELNDGKIDCVWNGMTLTDEVTSTMSCSVAYMNNAQVVVVPADVADQYKTAEDCKDLTFAVESGSAGMNMAKENGFNYTEVVDQATALMEVRNGKADAAIIDSLMAAAMV